MIEIYRKFQDEDDREALQDLADFLVMLVFSHFSSINRIAEKEEVTID
jgi:hypothetical protein